MAENAFQLFGDVSPISSENIKQHAGLGVSGPSTALPYADKIQTSFGSGHDLSGVKAHVGGAAEMANNVMNAKAYTSGDKVAFRQQPDLRLAAHEAAHVVQQRSGVSLSNGVGNKGDSYEKKADAVADRVAAGKSAADLLPSGSGGGGGDTVQRYVEMDGLGKSWRVSEDLKTAVSQEGGGGQTVYSTPDLVDNANSKLETVAKKGSWVRLEADGNPAVQIGDNKLHSVKPVFHDAIGDMSKNKEVAEANKPGAADATGDTSDKFAMYSDCGRSSRLVMGWTSDAPKAQFSVNGEVTETWRAYNPGVWTDSTYKTGMEAFLAVESNLSFGQENVHFKTGDKGGKTAIMPANGQQAKQQFGTLSEAGQMAFVKGLGINEAADPQIGGGYTMATGSDLPGFTKLSDMTWNFHWAGVVMKDGANNITLENYAIMFEPTGDAAKDAENRERAYNWVNKDWVFQMYGTKKDGQTFHEQHLASGTHGSRATSFAVKI